MYTTPEDWLMRFRSADGSVCITDSSIYPNSKLPNQAWEIWKELQGPDNLKKWFDVEAYLRAGPTVSPETN